MDYCFHISHKIDPQLKDTVLAEVKNYIKQRDFCLDNVPYAGLKQALTEITPKYDCEKYFYLTLGINRSDGAMLWLEGEFKLLAKLFSPEKKEGDR